MRKIIHIDMDAFYAAVEQRDDPGLRGRPVAVGAGEGRGVVMTASYEARPFGVRSAMPSAQARRLCPELVFVRPRFDVYKRESARIRAILARHTDLVEPLSLDEAYLDVTEPRGGPAPAVEIAKAIRRAIRDELGLTASAGVSFNKFLAKLASDLNKPDGLAVIRPEAAAAFIAGLPIERFHGVGPATARRMRELGIATGADLQAWSEAALVQTFGRVGRHYWKVAQGLDDRPVEPHRPRRSLSVETTFTRDIALEPELGRVIDELAAELAERLARASFVGRTVTLKLRYRDFKIATRRATGAAPFRDATAIAGVARDLLAQRPRRGDALRLLGIGISNVIEPEGARQLSLGLTETRSAAS